MLNTNLFSCMFALHKDELASCDYWLLKTLDLLIKVTNTSSCI
jgi:hypothetical protein